MKLRVVTLNVWALPWGLSRQVPARLDAIGHALADLDPDVVAFQEVWTEEARRRLVVAPRGPGWSTPGPTGPGCSAAGCW